jgi:aerobic-type carbon monoxide dehydrogenase small subunit (CoxS/CutS family)
MENQITLTVNGQQHSLTVTPTETLADTLRKRLKLTGTKIGCEEAECGICTVLVDGEPTLSCVYPAGRADGKDILTIEGLANTEDGKLVLHPLQDAFVQHGAVQCGFCIPGQILTSYALLKRNPEPSSDELRHALKDTLCRCAGYPTIENAILDAAHSLRTGEPIHPPHIPDSVNAKNLIGKSQIRPDAVEKVTGEAIYTDDLEFDGMLFASVCRAGVPHAILKDLDISKAQNLPGVVSVLTAEDIPGEHTTDWSSLTGRCWLGSGNASATWGMRSRSSPRKRRRSPSRL